jgi:hypothetical protein
MMAAGTLAESHGAFAERKGAGRNIQRPGGLYPAERSGAQPHNTALHDDHLQRLAGLRYIHCRNGCCRGKCRTAVATRYIMKHPTLLRRKDEIYDVLLLDALSLHLVTDLRY